MTTNQKLGEKLIDNSGLTKNETAKLFAFGMVAWSAIGYSAYRIGKGLYNLKK